MRIRVTDETRDKSGTAKGSGKPYSFRLQACLIALRDEVRKFWLEIPKDRAWLAPGEYEFTPSVRVNQFQELELGRDYSVVPVPVSKAA